MTLVRAPTPRTDVQFAAIIGTKDEGDVLRRLIPHLRRIGVGRMVILDHGSTDDTLEYLAEEEAAGDLWCIHVDAELDYQVLTRARVAVARSIGSEWVLFLDSDEFPLPRSGRLEDLAELALSDVISVSRYNVVLGPGGPSMPDPGDAGLLDTVMLYAQPIPDFYHHMLRHPETPWIQGVLEPKVMLRPAAMLGIEAGSHDVLMGDDTSRRIVSRELIIAHVPLRTHEQFRQRARNYQAAVAADPEWFTGYHGWQWVRFAKAADEGRIDEEFDSQALDAEALSALRRIRVVRSARQVFDEPIPSVADEAEYLDMARRAEPWLTAAGLVCRLERIAPRGKLEHISHDGQFPVVDVPPDLVVKFYGPWVRGHEFCDREVAALETMADELGPPVPRLVAHGRLDETYRYLLMTRVRGTPLSDLEAAPASVRDIADWIGRTLHAIHSRPLDGLRRGRGWAWGKEVTAWRRANAARFAARRGFPDTLVEAIDGWLPEVRELMGPPEEAVLCHGDLNDTNVLGWLDGTTFVPTGVIDFNQSFVGPAVADLGALWWHVLRRDRDALQSFLAESQHMRSRAPGFHRLALAWVLMTPTWDEERVEIRASTLDELASAWFGGSEQLA